MMEQKATGREEKDREQTGREETSREQMSREETGRGEMNQEETDLEQTGLEETGPGQTAGAEPEAATAAEKRTATGRCFPLRLASRTALALWPLPEAVPLADEMRARHADWVEKCL